MKESMHSELILRSLIGGLAIFACVTISSYLGIGAGWETQFAESILLLFEGPPKPIPPAPDYGLRSVMFTIGEPNDSRTIMRQTISVVQEFRRRGAKAVFVSIPGMLITDQNRKLLHELGGLGPILWEPLNYRVLRPHVLQLYPPLKDTSVRWGPNTSKIEPISALSWKWFPAHQLVRVSLNTAREMGSGRFVEDIVVQCLRLVRNYPDSLGVQFDGENFVLGSDEIPIDSYGSALVRIRHPFLRKDPTPISVTYGMDENPVLSFDGRKKEESLYVSGSDLSFVGDDLEGKIVVLGIRNFSDPLYGEHHPGFLASTVEALLGGHSLKRMDQWTMVIVLLTLIGGTAICLFLRLIPALAVTAGVAVCLIALHLWCYTQWQVIFEIQYPLLTLALSAAILPALKLARENTTLRQRLSEASGQ